MKAAIVLKSPNEIAKISEDFVIAADAGYIAAIKQNKKIDIAIGDFDSSKIPDELEIVKLNVEKDVTDGEAALDLAIEKGFKDITIYGLGGGKVDHILCNLALLARGYKKGVNVIAKEPDCTIYYKGAGKFSFNTRKGLDFSIIAFGDNAVVSNGVGCKYKIDNTELSLNNLGQGISNRAEDELVSFDILKGSVLVFAYNK